MASNQSKAKQKYDAAYNARPDQLKKRAARNAARREYEQKHGNLPGSVDVNHKTPLDRGGSNHMSNLEASSQTKNRGWRRGKTGYRT